MTDRERLYHEAVRAVERHGNQSSAARALGVARETLKARISRGPGGPAIVIETVDGMDAALLRDKIRTLTTQLQAARASTLTDEHVKRQIIGLVGSEPSPPEWLTRPPKKGHVTGVPTLFASDWHWGEVVQASQIGGVNSFDLAIAQQRARTMIEVAIDLLKTRFTNPEYPGIVFAIGGDLCSGDIHEELVATNETEIMPVIVDLWGILSWCITTLADAFGNVFVPCVTGNHARSTHKIRAKGRAFTSYEWLLYSLLAKRFENDKRIRFLIPDGPDAYYRVYSHRYLLTHGDQFRGGDGMIGALGPIIRGDHRKRSRNAQIGAEYDTMLLGHWHQLIQLQRLIVNGSLKGYDEYAFGSNFPFEPPRQALWLTHPDHGITFSLPVNVERTPPRPAVPWVTWR